jgi:hypothetical protein
MAFVIPSLIAEATALTTTALTELGISEAIATSAAGAVVAAGVKETEQFIGDGLKSATQNVIGEEAYNNAAQLIDESQDSAYATAQSFFNSDPKYLLDLKVKRDAERKAIALQKAGIPSDPADNKQSTSILQPSYNSSNLPYPDIKGLENQNKLDPNPNKSYSTKELADLVIQNVSAIAINGNASTESLDDAIETTIGTDVNKLTLMQRLSTFYRQYSADDHLKKYEDIARIYNGKGVKPSDMTEEYDFERRLLKFSCPDETGRIISLHQTTGFILPAIYGTYGGPSSANANKVRTGPSTNPQDNDGPDYPDLYFFYHDAAYGTEGYFHAKSDIQLVTRLTQNVDKWPTDSITLLNSIVVYFTTLATTISYLKGSLPDNVTKEVIPDMTKDDVFPILVPEALELPTEQYITKRFNFYKALEDDFKTASVTSSMFAESGFGANLRLKQEFDQIEIQIL